MRFTSAYATSPRRQLCTTAAVLVGLFLLVGPIVAASPTGQFHNGTDGISADQASTWPAERNRTKKVAGCKPSGQYCYGTFEQLMQWIRFDADGGLQIQLQADIAASVQASGYCTLFGDTKVLLPAGHPALDRFHIQIQIARTLGNRFRLNWEPNAGGHCELSRIYDPY